MKCWRIAAGTICFAFNACLLWFSTGCCEETLKMAVVMGQDASKCLRLLESGKSLADMSIGCPGDQVTVCWYASNPSGVELSASPRIDEIPGKTPIGGKHASSGTDAVAFGAIPPGCRTENFKVTVKALGGCAGSRTVTLKALSGDSAETFNARWVDCPNVIEFTADPLFFSSSLRAKDITADPTMTNAKNSLGTNLSCTTSASNPLFNYKQQEEVYNDSIIESQQTYAFSRPLRVPEHWRFIFRGVCPTTDSQGNPISFSCNQFASYPFNLTLYCPQCQP